MRQTPYSGSGAGSMVTSGSSQPVAAGHEPANLGDILERVLDRGIVIVGDIRVSLLDIELLTIKLRLVVASVDTARQMGIDWWEHDPWLTSGAREPLPDGTTAGAIGAGSTQRERRLAQEEERSAVREEHSAQREERRRG